MIVQDWWWARQREVLARYSARVVMAPTIEPITLAEARMHLNLIPYVGGDPTDPDAEAHHLDPWIEQIGIPVARGLCEDYTGRALAGQVVELVTNGFPVASEYYLGRCYDAGIRLPMSPVRGIQSITYVDGDGVTQTLDPSGYDLDLFASPSMVFAPYGVNWPAIQGGRNNVRVRYTAGYTSAEESPNDVPLPQALRGAILLTLGHLDKNRESTTDLKLIEVPMGATFLMDPWRINWSLA